LYGVSAKRNDCHTHVNASHAQGKTFFTIFIAPAMINQHFMRYCLL